MNFYQGMVLKECFLNFCLIFPGIIDAERLGIPVVLGRYVW